MSTELLKQVSDRYISAVNFHRNMRDIFILFSLNGFAYQHLYQYISESDAQFKLKEFITRTYSCFITDGQPQDFDLIANNIKNKKRIELSNDEISKCIPELWTQYRQWEFETLNLYESIASQLSKSRDVIGYNFVKDLAVEVSEELNNINDTITQYNYINWDEPVIFDRQDTIAERYTFKIRELYKKFPKFHHMNSMVNIGDIKKD